MPRGKPKKAEPFKNRFNEALYRQIARDLAELSPGFDPHKFLTLTLDGLENRELMDRMRQTATAAEAALPGTYREKLAVLRQAAPRLKNSFVSLSFCDFVARFGLEDFDHSMEALCFLTSFGSAEFAVRPFIQRDPTRALAIMEKWAVHNSEHVRRLASEGSRPRLPWGTRLAAVVADPNLTAPILELLKADAALYVRKSVANHLNDITKDHSDWVLARAASWDRTQVGTRWILRHALRTLVKKGHPGALAFLGADPAAAARVKVRKFAVAPAQLKLGDKFTLTAELKSTTRKLLPLVIDYVIHYAKAGGKTSAKVFKWTQVTLLPDKPLVLTKRQIIRDFTTRKHHNGHHRIELQINGQRLAETAFHLAVKSPKKPRAL